MSLRYVAAFLISTALMSYSFDIAHHAWVNTPDPVGFGQYIDPTSTKLRSKAEFIYGPFEIGAIVWLGFLTQFLPSYIRDFFPYDLPGRRDCFFIVLWFAMVLFVTAHQSSIALQAAARGSPAISTHNADP